MRRGAHISDEVLMLAIDGELGEARAAIVEAHLLRCAACRARRATFERGLGALAQLPPAAFHAPLPARLRVTRRWSTPALVGAAALVTVAVGLTWLSGQRASAAGPLPDARLTPGATRLISREQVCGVPAEEDDGRQVSTELARRVFRQYRLSLPAPKTYEVDFLITPALGGADDIRNLWPQPYASGEWNSRVKDALEDHLRRLVCEGRAELATVQREIASDWIAAYRKYFATDRPLAAHALFVKDRPWE